MWISSLNPFSYNIYNAVFCMGISLCTFCARLCKKPPSAFCLLSVRQSGAQKLHSHFKFV